VCFLRGPCRDTISRTSLETVFRWSRVAVAETVVVREPRGRGTSAVESRYQPTASEDATVCVIVNCKM
jgi:hypothetical protein